MANVANYVLRGMLESDRARTLGEVEYSFPYVYVILDDGQLRYVGFTTSPLARICDHMNQGRASNYDQFHFILAPSEDAGKVAERALIMLLAPPMNSAFMNRRVRSRDWPLMLDAIGLDSSDVTMIDRIEEYIEERKRDNAASLDLVEAKLDELEKEQSEAA